MTATSDNNQRRNVKRAQKAHTTEQTVTPAISANHPTVKTCKHDTCGKTFTPTHPNAKYCSEDHTRICTQCHKTFNIQKRNLSKNTQTCSASCASATSHTEKSKQTRQENSLKKYGTNHTTQNETIKAKIRTTTNANPERNHRIGSENFQKLIKDKYGVNNTSALQTTKDKKKESSQEKYGTDNPAQNPEVRKKQQTTMRDRYNTEHPMQNQDIKAKQKATMIKRYGNRKSAQMNVQNFNEYENMEEWTEQFEASNGRKPTIDEASKYFNVTPAAISKQKHAQKLHNHFTLLTSKKEEQFIQELNIRNITATYIRNDRTVLQGKEIDFYFPDHKLAIEISPTSTHHSSETATNYGQNRPKAQNYHLNKQVQAEQAGIELITIFDWMPWNKVMEMVTHKLTQSTTRIYARKTTAHYKTKDRTQLSKTLKTFINDNHVLGFTGRGTSHYTWLEHNGQIVAAAGWGKPRNLNIRKRNKENNDETIELTRMCFAPNYSIPGGASRLIKTFIKNHQETISSIITFSDCDLGSGKIYATLGFTLITKPTAQKNYVHPTKLNINGETNFTIKGTSLHLAGADRLLKNFPGYTPVGLTCQCQNANHPKAECLPNNREIVESYGLLPIYNCGYKKWELKLQ